MTVTAFPGGSADIEEPDWGLLLPDQSTQGKKAGIDNGPWRAFAHREWLRAVAALRERELLAGENRHAVQRLVIAYVKYDRACAESFRLGMVTAAAKSKVPMHNICATQMKQASEEATTLEAELCLPPRRRGSATKASKRGKTGSAAEGYLAKAPVRSA